MMSWPPYDNPMAYESLKAFRGNKIIYIGEGSGGCTGCDKFHNELNNNWNAMGTVGIPSFDGIYDQLYLYGRKQ